MTEAQSPARCSSGCCASQAVHDQNMTALRVLSEALGADPGIYPHSRDCGCGCVTE